MLRLRRIEIKNFVCFDDIVIEPSIDPERPLTVVRAENGSGKTTFLRAIRWGMYGDRGLPGEAGRYSLHPAWWQPSDQGIVTKVALEFETDGSTRYAAAGAATPKVYHLVRSVRTIGKPVSRSNEPDFRRVRERAQLMVREGDGEWSPNAAGVDAVVDQLLPWGLRDFFVMDADEAADFVGGSENKVIRQKDVVAKTTAAVDSLLGIRVFRDASRRVAGAARAFGAQATKAIGDANLNALQMELEELRAERSELLTTMTDQRSQKAEMQDRLRTRQDDLEAELKDIGAVDALRGRLAENRRRRASDGKLRRNVLAQLAGQLESRELFCTVAGDEVTAAYGMLRPLYERGHIPLRHLSFVREVLESQTCICGQSLVGDGARRRHVEELIAKSVSEEGRANYLGEMYEAARSLRGHIGSHKWVKRTVHLSSSVVELDSNLSDIELEKRDIDRKLDALDEEKIQVIRDEIATLITQLGNLNRSLAVGEGNRPSLDQRIDSLEKQISRRQRRERAATDKRAAEGLARLVVDILDRAYGTIRAKQVEELSERMNRLFAQMAANVSDEDVGEWQREKATLRMIAEVGLRAVESKPDEYEIYALN